MARLPRQPSCLWCSPLSVLAKCRRPARVHTRAGLRRREPWAQELAFQTSLNELPAELSGPGWARTCPPFLLNMVISSSGNVLIVPDLDPAFTVAAVTVQVLNL